MFCGKTRNLNFLLYLELPDALQDDYIRQRKIDDILGLADIQQHIVLIHPDFKKKRENRN